ncbi:MAG: hypothetical protein IJI59_05300 [Clostridia bacterium]|nr:hypothetical protein [Clostridia bacterium]
MKKITATVLFLLLLSVGALAEGLEGVIPDASIWGISEDDLRAKISAECEPCQVGEAAALRAAYGKVCSYDMDAYYVFEGDTPEGGLSKIAYILHDSDHYGQDELDQCLQTLADHLKETEGEPYSAEANKYIWYKDAYKIELGKGKLSKYTGSDHATVAIIFKNASLSDSDAPTPPRVLTRDDIIANGAQYIIQFATVNMEATSVDAVYMNDLGNGVYLFIADISDNTLNGYGKELRFEMAEDGQVIVTEAIKTTFVYTIHEQIPGEVVWGGDAP